MTENKMAGNKTSGPRKPIWLKILIPILIVVVVAGIWIIKNKSAQPSGTSGDNPDFALHVTDSLDLDKLKSYGLPILIDFGADSCIPCKEMAPILEELNKELKGKAIIRFVDVWKYQDLANGYPINVIPTQVLFDKDGKPYTPSDVKVTGMMTYSLKTTNEHVFTTHEGGLTKEQIMAMLMEMGLKE